MKPKVIWSLLSVLIAATFLISSCSSGTTSKTTTVITGVINTPTTAATTPKTTPTTTAASTTTVPTTTASNEPVYGGSMSIVVSQTGGFDPAKSINFFPTWCLIYDALVTEDWSKGPSGTGEIPLASNYTPQRYFVGALAESWEIVDPLNIIYHIRKDVHFWAESMVQGRELTADDIVFNFNRAVASPNSTMYNVKVTIKKIDKYTVQFTHVDAVLEIIKDGWNNLVIGAPEVAQKYGDMSDWKTVAGTGPYRVTDVVSDSSVTLTKNTNYFMFDPLHPANRLPYIDNIRMLVIVDPATQDAAIRTGKIATLGVPTDRGKSILKTNPELKSRRLFGSNSYVLCLRTDIAGTPLANVKVRQALSMAIDRNAIINGLYGGDATIMQWPYQPSAGAAFTPVDQLPADLKKLFEYHPQDAKALIAEAGYPTGFDLTIELLQGTYAGGTDLYSVVKSNWDSIGIKTTLLVDDATAFWSRLVGRTYKDTSPCAWGNSSPQGALAAHLSTYLYNYSKVNDPKIDKAYYDAAAEINDAKRDVIYKDIGQYIIGQQFYINLPTPYSYAFWQPWLKGYNGEVAWGTVNGWYGMYRFSWIDQSLKNK